MSKKSSPTSALSSVGEIGTGSPATEKADELVGVVCPYVKFTAEVIHRSQITNAPYNPRTIRESARDKLKAILKRVGLLTALVWNRRSGNLVGGHQRLSILDSLMRTKDYLIPVDVVDLDDAEEKAQNVALNNSDLMGEWDLAKMKELVVSGLDLERAGLDVGEVTSVFGLDVAVGGQEVPKIEELAAQLRDAQERHDRIKEASRGHDEANFYRVVVFKDGKSAQWLNELLDEPTLMFLNGDALRAKFQQVRE